MMHQCQFPTNKTHFYCKECKAAWERRGPSWQWFRVPIDGLKPKPYRRDPKYYDYKADKRFRRTGKERQRCAYLYWDVGPQG